MRLGALWAVLYDLILWPVEQFALRRRRRRLIRGLEGRVLDVGSGTGLTFPWYPPGVTVDAVEIDPSMADRSRRRARRSGADVRVHVVDARTLPFGDDAFDAAVVSFSLCTIPEPHVAVGEIRRVVRAGGEVRFLEHVRSSVPWLARLQDRVAPLWERVAGGCRANQDTAAVLGQAGYTIELDSSVLWDGLIQGTARSSG